VHGHWKIRDSAKIPFINSLADEAVLIRSSVWLIIRNQVQRKWMAGIPMQNQCVRRCI